MMINTINNTPRKGFTLPEVIAVLAIMTGEMALLLPAVATAEGGGPPPNESFMEEVKNDPVQRTLFGASGLFAAAIVPAAVFEYRRRKSECKTLLG